MVEKTEWPIIRSIFGSGLGIVIIYYCPPHDMPPSVLNVGIVLSVIGFFACCAYFGRESSD